jgi:hypothetical protein
MKAMKEAGVSLRAIYKWLNDEQGVQLPYSSMREAMAKLEQ